MYDVIGIQSHMHGGYWPPNKTWTVCERYSRFKVPLHYTETTVVSGPRREGKWETTAEGERLQAEKVTQFYRLLFSHPAVEAITWWDFTDQNAWQRAPAGLIRDDMSPKPAYDRLMELVKGKWWTRTAKAVARGSVRLRGFMGDYELVARIGSRRLRGSFSLDKQTPGTVTLQLA